MVANIVCLRRPAIKDSSNPSSALFLNLAKLQVGFLQLKEILLCQTSKGLKSKGSSADILFTRKNSHRTGSQLAPLHWPLVRRGVRLCIELQMPAPLFSRANPPLPSARTSACHLWQPALTFKRLLVGLIYPTNHAFTNKFRCTSIAPSIWWSSRIILWVKITSKATLAIYNCNLYPMSGGGCALHTLLLIHTLKIAIPNKALAWIKSWFFAKRIPAIPTPLSQFYSITCVWDFKQKGLKQRDELPHLLCSDLWTIWKQTDSLFRKSLLKGVN